MRAAPAGPAVLAYRALGLGDLLAGVPALRLLRRLRPDHRLVLAAPGVLRPLVDLALAGCVDVLLPTRELEAVAWPRTAPPPALAVDLHGNGPASRVLLEALRPASLVAFGSGAGAGTGPHAGPAWDVDEHERRRWCRLLLEELAPGCAAGPALDRAAADLRVDPPAAPSPAPGAVVVHPGAASVARRWPVERWAVVARALAADGHRLVVTGGPDEVGLARTLAGAAGLGDAAVLAGRTPLDVLAATVAGARLVLCGDTGVAHLATAYATPSVQLFGPTPPHRWGPPDDGRHTVLRRADAAYAGDPHAGTPDPVLLRTTVEDVLAAAHDRLRAARASDGERAGC